MTYKDNVYDVTGFIDNHPGGNIIMLAAGNRLEPYWNIYKQHTNNKNIVNDILEPMKIGKLTDYVPYEQCDPYIREPKRNQLLKFHSIFPCNAETSNIMDNYITPNKLWYIRNHSHVPLVNADNYNIYINGTEITLKDIKEKFPKNEIITTIQCAGNRRSEYDPKTSGTQWNYGAISTAKWGGVWLRDLLNDDSIKGKHVQFESLDSVKISIPIEKALNPFGDVMLAYEMNNEDISRDHGYPLRLIVPGYVGIRNLKWIKKIDICDTEADGPWQSGISYRPRRTKDEKIPTIQEYPVQSVIVEINRYDDNGEKYYVVKGFALSGGGRGIIRVDVSINGGKTWKDAKLREGSEQNVNKAWAWTFWDITFKETKNMDICCKATDTSYNTQPQENKDIWNMRGLINNSWHRV